MKNEWPVRVDRDGKIGVRVGWEPVEVWFRLVNDRVLYCGLTTTAEKPDPMYCIGKKIIWEAQKQAIKYLAIQRRTQICGKQLRLPL